MDSLYARYALAILSIAKDENKVQEYKEAFIEISTFKHEHPDVARYLESYTVKEEAKYAVVDKMCEPYKLKNLSPSIKLIIKKRRFHSLEKIVKEFIKEANEELAILEGYIYSASELDKKTISRVEKAISNNLNQKVELKQIVDSHLIGGIKVVINDHVYDGSLRGKLIALKTNLNERSE